MVEGGSNTDVSVTDLAWVFLSIYFSIPHLQARIQVCVLGREREGSGREVMLEKGRGKEERNRGEGKEYIQGIKEERVEERERNVESRNNQNFH